MTDTPYSTPLWRDTAVRFIKDKPGRYGMPDFTVSADFACALCTDPRFFYETDSEFVVYIHHFVLKDACLVTCCFPSDARYAIREVVFEGRYLPLVIQDGICTVTFEISGLTGPTRTLYAHTLLREDGLTLRIEENDPGRCAGKYSGQPYPAAAIDAAAHYIFAAREILHRLGLPSYLHAHQLGYLLLLGFETCNEVHTDWPPHWHMIFRWPYFCGSQAPHIYLDDTGRMTHNITYIDGIQGVSRRFEPGEWCRFVDQFGCDVMAFRIQSEGGMDITCPGGRVFSMSAFEPECGVAVSCEGEGVGRVHVSNDTARGVLRADWTPCTDCRGGYAELISYDPLTGSVLCTQKEAGV